jgi:hypothetical protein
MVALLPEHNNCYSAVARAAGVDEAVVRRAAKNPLISELSAVKKADLAKGFASLTAKLLNRYNDLADEATLGDKGVTLLGICADKALLYAGEANRITEQRGDLSAQAKALYEQALARLGSEEAAKEWIAGYPELSQYVN